MANPTYTNKLITESSPYLLQHANNPVNWYPWSEEALQKSKDENKLLLISIGYSACHWCHVMEKESFVDQSIAEIMNNNFICIKVDREERPDIDHIYMNAVQLITGSGGWPLNCFALPDGRPVYGGTYYKPDQWKQILESLSISYNKEPEKFEKAANEINSGIRSINHIVKVKEKTSFNYEDLLEIILKLRKNFDHTNGGTWGAPKFPLPVNYFPLIRYYYHSGDKDIIKHLSLTLKRMSEGGINDHLGGGFARYSVDREWLVPHFEKMLYDNAQLVSLYSDAYRVNNNQNFKRVVLETLGFVERELLSLEGGFYSSFDADSEGVEGKFYVWNKYEIDALLDEKSMVFCDYYDVSEEGNWDGTNILNIKTSKEEIAEKYKISTDELDSILIDSNKTLFEHREKRVKPGLDDKILTSWNALMAKAYINAYNVFKNPRYLAIAKKNIDFITSNLLSADLQLKRNYKNQKSSINAFLDDYAFLIEALIELYQSTFEEKYSELALKLTKHVFKHFFDKKTGMFFYTSDQDPELVARIKEINDHVIPASNSIMANNLFVLGHLYVNSSYIDIAEQMLLNVKDQVKSNPAYHGNWFNLMIQQVHKPYEICIVGENALEMRSQLYEKFIPNAIIAGGAKGKLPLLENRYTEGKTTIYVCQNNVCDKPVKSVAEALGLISNQ